MLLVVVLVGRLDTVKMMLTCRADKSKFDAGSHLSMVFHIMDTEIVVAVSGTRSEMVTGGGAGGWAERLRD